MNPKARAMKRLRALARVAYARQATRAAIDKLGAIPRIPGPGLAAIIASILGVLVAPCAVLADYFLLAAVVEYIASLASGSVGFARVLVPVAVVLVEVAVSLRQALEQYDPHHDGRGRHWNALIVAILGMQVAAAAAQYVALSEVNPSPANAVLLGFLALLALITHAATLFLSGNGILLLATACTHHRQARRAERLGNQLRRQTRQLLEHYRAFQDLSHQHQQERPDEPGLELEAPVVAELEDANRRETPSFPDVQPRTTHPPGPAPGPNEPDNPYTQWSDDQTL